MSYDDDRAGTIDEILEEVPAGTGASICAKLRLAHFCAALRTSMDERTLDGLCGIISRMAASQQIHWLHLRDMCAKLSRMWENHATSAIMYGFVVPFVETLQTKARGPTLVLLTSLLTMLHACEAFHLQQQQQALPAS